jgi:hypothetical protein
MTAAKPQLSVDQARLYFLLVMCNERRSRESGAAVARSYVAEKVMMLWRCDTAWEVRNRLDLASQRDFDEMVANEDFAPVRAPGGKS